jgi:hypothetical protein
MNNRSLGLRVTLALVLGAVGACESPAGKPSTTTPADPTAGTAGTASTATTPCQAAYGPACGAACSGDATCGAGLHCKEGKCAAECVQASDCGNGECTSDGHCDDIVLSPMETDPTPTGEIPKCIEGQVEFRAVVPQVWLLLDRSGSMTDSLGTTSRWAALGSVLLGDPTNPVDRGVVGEFEKSVAFGAVFYTTGAGASGCALDLESVALAANNYVYIRQRYNKLSPTGGTPTADSVAATVAVAASSDLTGGPKILVLATDGAPGGCSPRTGIATTEVEKEVEKAFQKKIQTFAISISTGTDATHMQRVANIGVGLPADSTTPATLYSAESQQQLKDAFSSILTEVPRSCVFELNGNVERPRAGEGTVVLAGQELPYGDPNGWLLKQADQVELVGSACAQIQAGEAELDISFPCAVFTPVVK